jgi:hypothetical protein
MGQGRQARQASEEEQEEGAEDKMRGWTIQILENSILQFLQITHLNTIQNTFSEFSSGLNGSHSFITARSVVDVFSVVPPVSPH